MYFSVCLHCMTAGLAGQLANVYIGLESWNNSVESVILMAEGRLRLRGRVVAEN